MKLNSSQLEAFYWVAQTLNFTKAASRLNVTQSALSQRVSKLEVDLETTLFIRDRSAVKLTEAGYRLLRYCEHLSSAEAELLTNLKGSKGELGGAIRIGGFSSVNRSLVIPALRAIMATNTRLSIKLVTKEIADLDALLKRSEVDYILTDRDSTTDDVESILLGFEQNVLVGSKKIRTKDVYIDHDENDQTTKVYFKQSRLPFKPRSIRYLDDVYGLIDGVKNGYGQAILQKHLVEKDDELVIINGGKILKTPVYLQFFRQPFYRNGHDHIVDALSAHFAAHLK
jgi:DNA-binding transcriptional LysR family regulator